MCLPAVVPLIIAGVGAAASAAGAVAQGVQRGKDLQNAADNANTNSQRAIDEGADSVARGAQAAGMRRIQGSQTLAKQKLAYASSGVDSTVGTPADVAFGEAAMTEFDAQTLANNAAREAFGHKLTADTYSKQGKAYTGSLAANAAATGLGVTGTLLGSAAGIYGMGAKSGLWEG